MAALNPVITQRLVDVAREVETASQGAKSAIIRRASHELCMSYATLYRKLKAVSVQAPRKRRTDAGQYALTEEEALYVSAYLLESMRRNGKRLASILTAVEALRSNGFIRAGHIDPDTGEFTPLAASTIARALRGYGLHPDQLMRATPKQQLRSLHPNHVWQIDPSLCVLYYLPRDTQLRCMPHDEFYKNKLDHVARVVNARVWRYVIVDHTSGAFYLEYVHGAESGQNLSHCFINAMQQRGPHDPLYGRPFIVMVDPGSANTGAVFRNLCMGLGVELLVNEPGKPWAKGSVEKHNDIVEREFEQGLKFREVTSLEALNAVAWEWMRHFNGTRKHSRTNRTRYAVWQLIRPDQLVTVPGVDVLRELAVSAPEERVVENTLQIRYRGRQFDVSEVPGVMVGEKLLIARNAFREDGAQVIVFDAEGRQTFHQVEPIALDEFGFKLDGAVLGQSYKRHKISAAEKASDRVEMLLMEAGTPDEAKARRKARHIAFGGKLNPYKDVADTPLPHYLPKRGTELALQAPVVETPSLSVIEVARRLKPELGDLWDAEAYAWVQRSYPEGACEDDLPAIESAIRKMHAPGPGLRVVGGT